MAKAELPTTQRAYTLRLRPAILHIDSPEEIKRKMREMQEALWATHEAVNKGAKAFGDWLLTLRGGLDHALAEGGPVQQRKDRRILLALSWLSVEDAHGAPDEYEVDRSQVAPALADILRRRGLPEPDVAQWLSDCGPSLQSEIREDATWVNRSAAFDQVATTCASLTRDEVWDFLEPFFASPKAYLFPEASEADAEANADADAKDDQPKDLVQKAGGWLSKRMGSGTGADFSSMAIAYDQMAAWAQAAAPGSTGASALADLARHLAPFSPASQDAEGVLSVISGPGYKSATRNVIKAMAAIPSLSREDLDKLRDCAAEDAVECRAKVGGKGPRPYSDMIIHHVEQVCGFTYLQADGPARHREFSVMLDHAARRVNVAYSWIKNAEARRRQFEADSGRMTQVPADARAWLEAYCTARGTESGSLEPYRIRRRAIDGWEQIVQRWSRADCLTEENRIAAARALQDDPEIDKFGDIQLFEALADDDALCVWRTGGDPNAKPLKDFVFATDAMAKRIRFKVPAYRHPDPLRHPVFTDFGNSRWDIDFSAHRAPAALDDLAEKEKALTAALADAQAKLQTAKESKQPALTKKIAQLQADLEAARGGRAAMAGRHRVQLRLWNGSSVAAAPLRWSCKRLVGNLALCQLSAGNGAPVPVTRADRLGRAAAGADGAARVAIIGLFDDKDWNGRLQAPRAQLDAIARHVDKHGWDTTAQTMLQRIRWLLSFSAKLTPQGPWTDLASRLDLKPDPQYWPHADANKKRQGHAKLILSRLPGLRILSVDLGHRFAAACAVWEAISTEQMNAACNAARVPTPGLEALYVHLPGKSKSGGKTTTIYRRIGPDTLPDGKPHPAPWARLDRQFLIKLQGEDRPARKASPAEIVAVEDLENWAGRDRDPSAPPRNLAVDQLMSDAVRTARLALGRHARRARIAHNLTATTRTRPGAIAQPLTDEARVELLTDSLADWHALATDDRWDDPDALDLWNWRLAGLPGGFTAQRRQPAKEGEEPTKAQRKKADAELRQSLQPLARKLAADEGLRRQLHDAWAARWTLDDQQWRRNLTWLSRWLMPRGGQRRHAARRHVGGLSLTRLSTLTEFRRKVQVGFFTRMKPDGARVETERHFGQKTLDRIERLKDNRIKQLASRIVEAALGVGIERHSANGRDLQRPRQRINDPRFAPCHAVVIENLSNYRPEETRTRRENRATMDWKSAEAKKRLQDACQLHGLHLRDVNPQYTSRQDSRTGAPGVRCTEVPVGKFLSMPFWQKQVAQARRKADDKKGDAREQFLLDLHAKWSAATEDDRRKAKPLRIPLKGGDLFISAAASPDSTGGIQADLNAAANIGLRALIDPDFAGRWWYVPCDTATRAPRGDKVNSSILDGIGPLSAPPASDAPSKKGRKSGKAKEREVVNLWRDPSAAPITGGESDPWADTSAYWARVQYRIVQLLHRRAGLAPDQENA